MHLSHQRLFENCALKKGQIDVWQYPLHTEPPEAESILSTNEQLRAKRFHFPRHQRRFIMAHSVLRLILARYLDTTPHSLNFTEGKYGKPALDNFPFLHFNLSHSGDMALLAIGTSAPLGVDVEYISARPYIGIGQQLFSIKENKMLKASSKALSPLTFFNIWVQKEALIKACGMGLSYPTQQFDVPSHAFAPETIIDALHQKTWNMITFMPQIGCCAALCYDPCIQNIRYSTLSMPDIVEIMENRRI